LYRSETIVKLIDIWDRYRLGIGRSRAYVPTPTFRTPSEWTTPVRTIALETTEVSGSLAAFDNHELLAEIALDPDGRSAQTLAPGLVRLWQTVGWRPTAVELVAVAVGPGSFTGLRVGVTTAKLLAYAAGAEVLGVDTLEVIANRAPAEVMAVSAAVDAQREQVVVGEFRRAASGVLIPTGPEELLGVDTWLDRVAAGTWITGPALRKWAQRVPEPLHSRTLDPTYWSATAAAVGLLAIRQYSAGRRDDLWKLLPRYSRRAAAEEKWEVKQRIKNGG
jgi:tRNA threonylcarbamoyladenosine biosynthesis protein TsaB